MMLTSQAQQTVMAISSYLINLLFKTGDVYCKKLRLKACSYTLKKHLYGILDYAKVEFFHPLMLLETCKHYPYKQVGSNSLQMVQNHSSGLGTAVHPRTGTPLGYA